MGLSRWILLIYLFTDLCTLVRPRGRYPDFFYDETENHNKQKHKSKPSFPNMEVAPDYYEPEAVEPPQKPPNALQEREKPRPFYTIGRGDPSDQNMIEQQKMQENDDDSVFPEPDGKPFSENDNFDLEELPKRLTQTNKWEEFNELRAAAMEKYKGKVLEDWHDDAHMWAGYSRHLLERDEKAKKKTVAARTLQKPVVDPSFGLSPYWAPPDDNEPSTENSAVPWGHGKGPAAGIEDMKDLGGTDDAPDPFPWDAAGGQGLDEGPGGMGMGESPPSLLQGDQFHGGGSTMDGGPPHYMGLGDGPGSGGQFPGGDIPPGMGGRLGPGGQFPGGGMPPGMDGRLAPGGQFPGGGMPPSMGHGGRLGSKVEFPGGGMPPGMGQGGGLGPRGQFPDGGMSPSRGQIRGPHRGGQFPGGGMPTNMGQRGGSRPGEQFPGGGMPSDKDQGGGPGPGGNFSDDDDDTDYDMPEMPGGGLELGGQFPGGSMPLGRGKGRRPNSGGQFPVGRLPPGMGQGGGPSLTGQFSSGRLPPGMVQGGGPSLTGQFSIGRLPPGMGQGGGPSLTGQFSSGRLPPGMGQGRELGQGGRFPSGGKTPGMVQGGGSGPTGQFLGDEFSMGGVPPSSILNPGKSVSKNGTQDSGASQPPDAGYDPVGPTGPAGGWVPGGDQGPDGGLGPVISHIAGRAPGLGERPGKGNRYGPARLPGVLNGGFRPVGPPGPARGWIPAKSRGPGEDRGSGMGRGGTSHPGSSWAPGGRVPPGLGWDPGMFNGSGGTPGTGGNLGLGGRPSPGMGGGPGGLPGPGEPLGQGRLPGSSGPPVPDVAPSAGGPPNAGGPPVAGGLPSPGGPTGPGGSSSQGGHRRSLDQSKKDEKNNTKHYVYYDFMNRPTRTPDTIAPEREERFLIPGTIAEENIPEEETDIELLKSLTATPKPKTTFATFDERISMDQIPTGTKDGKIPGPGSEGDFPNGYRPNYANLKQPGMAYPEGNYGMGRQQPQNYLKTSALRQGVGAYGGSMDYRNQAAPQSFQPGNMARSPVLGNLKEWPPGIGGPPPPPPGYKLRGRPPPGFMDTVQPSGMRGGPPPGYMQGRKSPGKRGGHTLGYTKEKQALGNRVGALPEYMQEGLFLKTGRDPPPGYIPTSYEGFRRSLNNSTVGERGDPKPPGPSSGKPTLRQGGGLPSMDKYGWPPSEMSSDSLSGYQRGGPPSDYMSKGPPRGRYPPGMEGGLPPAYMQGRPKAPPAISGIPSEIQQNLMDRPPPSYLGSDTPGIDQHLRYGTQNSPPASNQLPSGYQLMKIAQRKIQFLDRLDKISMQPTVPSTEHLPTLNERLKALRQFDDFNAPVRWVRLTSSDTKDGLARVTDKKSHQNQQFVIEGELYVPIADESMDRLGWTTESYNETSIEITTRPNIEERAIRIVMRSMNLNYTSQEEWLAYETVLGTKFNYEPECSGEACQTRCHKTGCDCTCKGDSCASGCVGVSCNAVCKGPGCKAMCIGEQCTAKCEGMNCEAKCWGTNCASSCSLLSCTYTTNGGYTRTSNATWDELYPQYGQKYSNPYVPVQREGKDYGHAAEDYYD